MPVRSNTDHNKVQDRTSTINKIENQWGLVTQLGLFQPESVRTRSFQYDVIESGYALIPDTPWGSRRDQFVGKEVTSTHSFSIPHFTFDGKISPDDVSERRMPGTDQEFDTLDRHISKELLAIRQSWAMTREFSHVNLITTGTVYAPNNTVSIDYFASLQESRKIVYYDIDTANSGSEVWEKGEEVRSYIRQNLLDGSIVNNYVVICSPEFFKKMIVHDSVRTAYQYYQNNNRNGEILKERLPTMIGGYRTFFGGDGMMYIEYDGVIKGQQLIPANKAYAIPMDTTNLFKTFYAPMSHVDYVNTPGQEQYAFVYELDRGRGWDIETEANFADFCAKPRLIVELRTASS